MDTSSSRLDELERRLDTVQDRVNVERIKRCVAKQQIFTAVFKRVPADYYDKTLEERRQILGATSISQLCKTIVLENTSKVGYDVGDPTDSKYYAIVVQYEAKIDVDALAGKIHALRPPSTRLPRKHYKFQLAPEAVSTALTGFIHNAVTVFGMHTPLPVVVCQRVLDCRPAYVFLGGGAVDVKLGLGLRDLTACAGAEVVGYVSSARAGNYEED